MAREAACRAASPGRGGGAPARLPRRPNVCANAPASRPFSSKPGVRLERDRVQPALDGDRVQAGGRPITASSTGRQLRDRGQVVSRGRKLMRGSRGFLPGRPTCAARRRVAAPPLRRDGWSDRPQPKPWRARCRGRGSRRRGHAPHGPLRCARRTPANGRAWLAEPISEQRWSRTRPMRAGDSESGIGVRGRPGASPAGEASTRRRHLGERIPPGRRPRQRVLLVARRAGRASAIAITSR